MTYKKKGTSGSQATMHKDNMELLRPFLDNMLTNNTTLFLFNQISTIGGISA